MCASLALAAFALVCPFVIACGGESPTCAGQYSLRPQTDSGPLVNHAHLVLSPDGTFEVSQRVDTMRDGLVESSRHEQWEGTWEERGGEVHILGAKNRGSSGPPTHPAFLGLRFDVLPGGGLKSTSFEKTAIYDPVTSSAGFEVIRTAGELTEIYVHPGDKRLREVFLSLAESVEAPGYLTLEIYFSVLLPKDRVPPNQEAQIMYLDGLAAPAFAELVNKNHAALLGHGIRAMGYSSSRGVEKVILWPQLGCIRVSVKEGDKYQDLLRELGIHSGPALRDLKAEFSRDRSLSDSAKAELMALVSSLMRKGLRGSGPDGIR